VDKKDVQLQSPNMEHEAFIRSMSYIFGKITCSELVSDAASSSIRKTIGIIIQCVQYYSFICKCPDMLHSLDIWHKAKKLRKALNKVLI